MNLNRIVNEKVSIGWRIFFSFMGSLYYILAISEPFKLGIDLPAWPFYVMLGGGIVYAVLWTWAKWFEQKERKEYEANRLYRHEAMFRRLHGLIYSLLPDETLDRKIHEYEVEARYLKNTAPLFSSRMLDKWHTSTEQITQDALRRFLRQYDRDRDVDVEKEGKLEHFINRCGEFGINTMADVYAVMQQTFVRRYILTKMGLTHHLSYTELNRALTFKHPRFFKDTWPKSDQEDYRKLIDKIRDVREDPKPWEDQP